jgi:hypothetical protein
MSHTPRGACHRGARRFFKIRHSNFLTALLSARATERDNKYPPDSKCPLSVYHCAVCGFEHVGRVPRGTVWLFPDGDTYGPIF